jgi:hypothetical protein
MIERQWQSITGMKLIAFLVGLSLLLLALWAFEPGYVPLLDHANLLLHEAGHPLVGFFSARLGVYGGTLGQLVFPCILVISFWCKRQPLGVAVAVLWFCESLFNISVYVADARALRLPLIGGGDHDWNTILFRWNLLQYDQLLALGVRVLAWAGIALVCAWVLWRAWQDRARNRSRAFSFSLP